MTTQPSHFRVGLIQMSVGPDPDAISEKAIARIREAASAGANIVCLPELISPTVLLPARGYCLFDCAEPIPGRDRRLWAAVARELGVTIVASAVRSGARRGCITIRRRDSK